MLIAAFALLSATAHAAPSIDPLCGTRLTAGQTLTLTRDIDCTYYAGNADQAAISVIGNGVTIDGTKPGGGVWKIIAPDAPRAISSTGFNNLTIKNVDVSGWCGGYGIYIDGGTAVMLDTVIASQRDNAVYAKNTSGLTVMNFTADGSRTNGLFIDGATTGALPTLQNLTITNGETALRVNNVTGPWTIGPSALTSTAGNQTGIDFTNGSVVNVTVQGTSAASRLTVFGQNYGINAYALTNKNLTFTNLDVSGYGGGTSIVGSGIYLDGDGHTLTDVKADGRQYGVWARGATTTSLKNLTVRRLSVEGAAIEGLRVDDMTLSTTAGSLSSLTIDTLKVTNSRKALVLNTFTGIAGAPFVINPSVLADYSGSLAAIHLSGVVKNVTVTGAAGNLWVLKTIQNAVTADGGGTNAGLRFEHLDVSGFGAGTNVGYYGIYVSGAGVVVDNVTANGRYYGAYFIDNA